MVSEPEFKPCGNKFTAGDVVRWEEPAWYKGNPYRRRKKPLKTGDLLVTGQILEELDNGFVSVEVIKCKVLKVGPLGIEVVPHKKHDTFRRKRSTIARKGERMVPKAEAPPRLHASKFTRSS